MTRFLLIATASIALGSGTFGCNRSETSQSNPDNRTAGEKTRDAVATAGQKTGDAMGTAVDKTKEGAQAAGQKMAAATQPSENAAANGTRDVLASVVQAAVTRDGLGDVVDKFSKADRDRIGKLDKATWTDLNTVVDKFRADWKAKYNEDFKIGDKEQVVFGAPVEIQFGQVGDAQMAANKTGPDGAANDKSANNSPRVSFPGMDGMSPVKLQFVNEGTVMSSYKIDVPDTLDGGKLLVNLTKHLSDVQGMKDKWPADVNEAYRTVAAHVAAAITDAH